MKLYGVVYSASRFKKEQEKSNLVFEIAEEGKDSFC